LPHVILYGRLMSVIIRILWIVFLSGTLIYGSVAPNPFLRPGSGRKAPPVVKPVFKPKSIVRPNVAQEVEFKGYFILKGQVYFSIYNKKVGHGEWISINEKTYEEFMVQEFNLETETLTILYEDQSFDLKLLESKSGTTLPSFNQKTPVLPKSISRVSKSSTPRIMPPKPKSNPVIPPFLVNRTENNRFPFSNSRAVLRSSTANGASSFLPGLPYPGFVPRRTVATNPGLNGSNPSPSSAITGNLNEGRNSSTSIQNNTSTNPSTNNNGSASGIQQVNNTNNSNGEIDLSNLPPPPPPPNILPPSPPPNLLPARED
jgi:hypothetical protein